MALKFREIIIIISVASATTLLIFLPLAILLSPSAGYVSLGYHPYLTKIVLCGLSILMAIVFIFYGLTRILQKQSRNRFQSE